MAHFIEQYTHMLKMCDDFDALAGVIDICISKNVINSVSTDIKEVIDNLSINTPYYNFMRTMVWAASVSDHTETSLNLLKHFCNKVVGEVDSWTMEPDEFSLMILVICAENKQFILKLSRDRQLEIVKTISQWFLAVTKEDDENVEVNDYLITSMQLILQGKISMEELDRELSNRYKEVSISFRAQHEINELGRPFQALFINIVQNMDQEKLLHDISVDEWNNKVFETIQRCANRYVEKTSTKVSYEDFFMIINDFIWGFRSLNEDMTNTGYIGIDNKVVGKFVWRFLERLHQIYNETSLGTSEIVFLLRDAYDIFISNFAVNENAKHVINNMITSYAETGDFEDSLLRGDYFKAIKLHLDQDELFALWVSEFKDNSTYALLDRVYATYIQQYMDSSFKNTLPVESRELLEADFDVKPEVVVNESMCDFLNNVGNFVHAHYDDSREIVYEGSNYSKENKYPIFIILTLGSTILSKMITKSTGDSFSHSSVSFNTNMDPLYSFGTKKFNGANRREMGFVETNPYSDLWGEVPVKYEIYVTYVDKEAINRIQDRLNYFIENKDNLKYDFPGLAKIYFKIKSTSQAKWFCSRFVAELISNGKSIERDPSLYRPQTLKEISDVELVMSGSDFRQFDKVVFEKNLAEVKKRALQEAKNSTIATEANSAQWDEEDIEEEEPIEDNEPYDGPEIEAKQSTKGYKKSSKTQSNAQRKIYKSYKKFKDNEAKVDSQLAKMLTAAKKAFSQDKTEEIIEGKRFTPIGLLKKILITGAIFSFSKIAGFVYLLVSHTLSKKRTEKQRAEILIEIETEIKLLDEKIEDARGDGNRKAKYALMRTKAELTRARDKIKFNLNASKNDLKTALKTAKSFTRNDNSEEL